MADALASGASVRKDVGVQVPPRPRVEQTVEVTPLMLFSQLLVLDKDSREPNQSTSSFKELALESDTS